MRIILADDHQLLREGLAGLLARESDLDVVGQAMDGVTTVRMACELQPDVVVMDVKMPQLSGIDATQHIVAHNPAVKVLGLSGHEEPRIVAAMIDAGAAGYVLKDSAFDELARALRATAANQTYLSPAIAGIVVAGFRSQRGTTSQTPLASLTPREREIAQLLAEGWSTKEIAGRLHVSPKTIGTHREHIMAKLQIRSIAELTRRVLAEGLV